MFDGMDIMFKPIVLVTGFGPFLKHPINASWEAVKIIDKDKIEKTHNVELVLLELPVTYSNVDEFVPALWETHTPKLMLHVGVSKLANHLTLETQAHRKGYSRMDYLDKCPPNHICTAEGAIRLHTQLNVERICKEFNEHFDDEADKVKAQSSKDAGRYVCEYTYYTSLSVDNTRTLFVHVPDMHIFTPNETAKGLEKILDLCLEQILEVESSKEVTDKMKETTLNDVCEDKRNQVVA